jgi:hypothetical protein
LFSLEISLGIQESELEIYSVEMPKPCAILVTVRESGPSQDKELTLRA